VCLKIVPKKKWNGVGVQVAKNWSA